MAKAKIKKFGEEDCIHVIHPLGKGLPLCTFGMKLVDENGKLPKIRDFPMCVGRKKCPHIKFVD